MPRRVLQNVGLLGLALISTYECYFGWGWSIPGAAAAVALTRPWLAADTDVGAADRGSKKPSPPP